MEISIQSLKSSPTFHRLILNSDWTECPNGFSIDAATRKKRLLYNQHQNGDIVHNRCPSKVLTQLSSSRCGLLHTLFCKSLSRAQSNLNVIYCFNYTQCDQLNIEETTANYFSDSIAPCCYGNGEERTLGKD